MDKLTGCGHYSPQAAGGPLLLVVHPTEQELFLARFFRDLFSQLLKGKQDFLPWLLRPLSLLYTT